MFEKFYSALTAALLSVVLILGFSVSAGALEDKYTIDELKMSIKIPKEYAVVTRTTAREDAVFSTLGLDYDETMTAFSAANIYLQATSEDGLLKITLTKTADDNTKAINNYSELGFTEREQVLDAFMQSGSYTSGVEIKHNGNIYFDMALAQQTPESVIYCYQCHTVVNGMNINLTLQKSEEELTSDEIKVVTSMANTVSFDKIVKSSGPSFDWWRILLWIVLLVAIALLANYFYAQYGKSKKQKIKRTRKVPVNNAMSEEDKLILSSARYEPKNGDVKALLSDIGLEKSNDVNIDEPSFDEFLGYDTTDYSKRANTEFDTFEIKVKTRNEKSGVSYFEDSGRSIHDKKDYFEEFFSEKTESRPLHKRFLSTIALYIKILCRRIKAYFKNPKKSAKKKSAYRRR